MTFLIDTDWVAEHLRGRPGASQLLDKLAAEGVAISLITYGELYEGILYGKDPEKAEAALLAFLSAVPVIPLDQPTMRRFAEIRGALRRHGHLISDPDLLIAATAMHHGLTLVTRNLRHFERIPGLRILASSSA